MAAVTIHPATDALVIIDLQPDFQEGGALAVPGGNTLAAPINRLATLFDTVVATQDWHPADHSSFAIHHPGRQPYDMVQMPYGPQRLWPVHCVQGTPGAELDPALDTARLAFTVRKGFNKDVDSYSGFFENDRTTATGLATQLRERGISRVFLAGLATDFCVGYSAEDAARLGFDTFVIDDLCRGIGLPLTDTERAGTGLPSGTTTIDLTRTQTVAAGVRWIDSKALIRPA